MEYASKTEAINGADNTKIMTPLRVKQSILANGQSGGVVEEVDPIFKSSPAYNITDTDITNWNSNTYTAGTGISIENRVVALNAATNTTIGGVYVEANSGLTLAADGKLSIVCPTVDEVLVVLNAPEATA